MASRVRRLGLVVFNWNTRPAKVGIIYSYRPTSTAVGVLDVNQDNYVKKKFSALMKWYEEVTGMDEVRLAQNRVLDAEEKFISAQERRRAVNKEVATVQAKLKELYGELESTSRGEERYVQLITQEHRVLKEERSLIEEFSRCEREERDGFSTLSTAVKDSHEKERAQAEKTKYWSIIGSIIGTVIGIFGSSINNEIKMKQLRRLVQDSLVNKSKNDMTVVVPEALSKYEQELSGFVQELKHLTSQTVTQPNDEVLGRLNEIIHNLDSNGNGNVSKNDVGLLSIITKQEETNKNNFEELKELVKSQIVIPEINGDQIVVMPIGLEDRLGKHYKETQQIVILSTVIAIALPIIFKYIGLT